MMRKSNMAKRRKGCRDFAILCKIRKYSMNVMKSDVKLENSVRGLQNPLEPVPNTCNLQI